MLKPYAYDKLFICEVKKVMVSNEVLDFLTDIHEDRNNEEKRKKAIFDRAFEMAYKDMSAHTVVYKSKEVKDNYSKEKRTIRNAIKDYIMEKAFADFLSDPQKYMGDKFNEWHENACESVTKIDCEVKNLKGADGTLADRKISDLLYCRGGGIEHVFSCGQAQKLINMMVKYLYIYYQCDGYEELENIKYYAHAPIDRYVLKKVFKQESYNGIPWSQIKTYEDYKICKEAIDKAAAAENYESAFLWELAKWPFKQK